MRAAALAVFVLVTLAACGSSSAGETSPVDTPAAATDTADAAPATEPDDAAVDAPTDAAADAAEQAFPDVVGATAEASGDTWTVSATLSSPYDSPERYADAWRVIGPDGTVFAERILTHDHADEQPFTRSQPGVEIPDNVSEVTIEGRDLANGYGGDTFVLTLDR